MLAEWELWAVEPLAGLTAAVRPVLVLAMRVPEVAPQIFALPSLYLVELPSRLVVVAQAVPSEESAESAVDCRAMRGRLFKARPVQEALKLMVVAAELPMAEPMEPMEFQGVVASAEVAPTQPAAVAVAVSLEAGEAEPRWTIAAMTTVPAVVPADRLLQAPRSSHLRCTL